MRRLLAVSFALVACSPPTITPDPACTTQACSDMVTQYKLSFVNDVAFEDCFARVATPAALTIPFDATANCVTACTAQGAGPTLACLEKPENLDPCRTARENAEPGATGKCWSIGEKCFNSTYTQTRLAERACMTTCILERARCEQACDTSTMDTCVGCSRDCEAWEADCRLSCPVRADACKNGQKDGDETDVDCGGACGPCGEGNACKVDADCQFSKCESAVCGKQKSCKRGKSSDCGAGEYCMANGCYTL